VIKPLVIKFLARISQLPSEVKGKQTKVKGRLT